ncbi:L-serine ammonia-lyase [Nonomuraea sp. NPDC005692]|uniref:L-serine ammonia-lyase n=1 Tax=Nonomuraea sp. NPDC005692 TaxID=3157168 RepID=UPI0033F1BCE6
MPISVFDLFKVGIGPSSSHTCGPMTAAGTFVQSLRADGLLHRVSSLQVILYGSLGLTGLGHGSDKAVILGLQGATPELLDVDTADACVSAIRASGVLPLDGRRPVPFRVGEHLLFERRHTLPHHPNGMRFTAYGEAGEPLREQVYYSVGGGFVVAEPVAQAGRATAPTMPYPFTTAAELLAHCDRTALPISALMLENERAFGRSATEIREGLLNLWEVMRACVARGCSRDGMLPGGLQVRRRAHRLHRALSAEREAGTLNAVDWVSLFALAVNEENASGGRVVTAPTNGAAGIVPAVLHYYDRYVPGADDNGVIRFLLTAGAIGVLFKENASISGAEVGCQGEVGSACSMAAAGLTEILGGTPRQVENAAEIGIEHNLGLTCDPVAGLVQIPCIERNAVASVKAVAAARIALRGDGVHLVCLDTAIRTMRDTGRDMLDKYKETSLGGLAVNVVNC